eukprot:4572727-Pleurochrysis_carterae.AAC.1
MRASRSSRVGGGDKGRPEGVRRMTRTRAFWQGCVDLLIESDEGQPIEPSWRRSRGSLEECVDCARIF